MKIEQIRQVMEIYQTGSINKAAQNLFTSQPCISNSLKSLEKELNQKIFQRNHSGAILTDFGEIFVKNAHNLLRYADQIELEAQSMTHQKPPLSFSVSVDYLLFAYAVFRQLIEKYQNSSTNFRYNQVNVSDVISDVYNRTTELGLISIPTINKTKWLAYLEVNDLQYERIHSSRPSAMISDSNPHFQRSGDEIQLNQLAGSSMVVIQEKLPLFNTINQRMCQMIGAKSIIQVNDRTTAHEFIQRSGAFACVVRCDAAYRNIDFFEYAKTYYIRDLAFEFEIGWITKKNSRPSSIALEYMGDVNALLNDSHR